jgi:hypothetical protein
VRRDLARASSALTELQAREQSLQSDLKAELAKPDIASGSLRSRYDRVRVRDLRRELAATVEQRETTEARIEALRGELPARSKVDAAMSDARLAIADFGVLADERREAWQRFADALDNVEVAARAVAASTAQMRDKAARVSDLAVQYDLSIEAPTIAPPDARESAVMTSQAHLARQVAGHQAIDPMTDAELTSRRRAAVA